MRVIQGLISYEMAAFIEKRYSAKCHVAEQEDKTQMKRCTKDQETHPYALHAVMSYECFSAAECGVTGPEETLQTGL